MIQTLAANRANPALHVSPLPRRARGGKHLLDSHGLHIFSKLITKDAVSVTEQVAWDLVKGESLPQLLGCPFRRRMSCALRDFCYRREVVAS